MVIDMLVQPMLYGEICTPGDEPDGFGFWSREFGMGHMGPMDWDELQVEMDVCDVQKSLLMPLDVTTACGGHFGTNDQIAMLVAAHPDRLWGFASVDPQVSGAADELERAFTELGQRGFACILQSRVLPPMMLWPSRFTSCASAITSRWFSMPVCLGSLAQSSRAVTRLHLSTQSQRIQMCALV